MPALKRAARGGKSGAAFAIVAQAMGELAGLSQTVASDLQTRTRETIGELERVNQLLATQYRGNRLSDLALTNIDLIDRNLYERSCDVRWWATDPSAVEALSSRSPEACQFASRRLGTILDSYTVYFDLVLCDPRGVVVANGRPNLFSSVGSSHADATWFRAAMRTQSASEFGFQSVHLSPLVNQQRALVYSCAIRPQDKPRGTILGVLGIVFNWDGLAQTIVEKVPLDADERTKTRVCIVDQNGLVLADTHGHQLRETIQLPNHQKFFSEAKNFAMIDKNGRKFCVAHARSPGFETYSTGWHSLLMYQY